MKVKTFEKVFTILQWIVFLVVAAFIFTMLMQHDRGYWVNYEYPEGSKRDAYNQTDPSNIYYRYQVWEHRGFQKPIPAYRDDAHDQTWYPNDDYLEEAYATWPASAYPNSVQHFFWLWLILALIALGATTGLGGNYLQNLLIVKHLRRNPDPGECAYYLNGGKKVGVVEVRKLMAQSSSKYLINKDKWHFPQFMSNDWRSIFSTIVSEYIEHIQKTGNNTFPLTINIKNEVLEQDAYLHILMNQAKALNEMNEIQAIRNLQGLNYEPIVSSVNSIKKADLSGFVCYRLTKFFSDIIGDELFRFEPHITNEDVGNPDISNPGWLRASLSILNSTGNCFFGTNKSDRYPYLNVSLTYYFPSWTKAENGYDFRLSCMTRKGTVPNDFRYTKDDYFSLESFYRTMLYDAIHNTDFSK